MKELDTEYFIKIQQAYDYDAASTCNWADGKIREIQDYLKFGNSIKIKDHNEYIEVNTIFEISEWIKSKTNLRFTFDKQIDLIKSVNKLNINIGHYQVCKLELMESENGSNLFNLPNLNISLYSENGQSFYAGIKNVIMNDFKNEDSIINLKNLSCRILKTEEIKKIGILKDLDGYIGLSFEYYSIDKSTNENKTVVGREIEN